MSDDLLPLRRELRALSAKKRVDRILERKDAMRVVRQLPVHDLYATLREVGVEDALELLELCSPKQVQTFLDLDGWKGDRLDSTAVSQWLRALFAANPDRAAQQLAGLDLELLTLLFKMHCRVYDLSAGEEPEGELGRHVVTPDQRYLIAFGGIIADEGLEVVLQSAVTRLMARDMLFVLRLCEAMRWELPSSLEEEALRWRTGRLGDLGFLPKDDATAIFAWLDPDQALPTAAPVAPPSTSVADPEAASGDLSTSVVFPWSAAADGASALGQALADQPDRTRERVAHEVMLVANRVSCAEGADLGDPEALRETARQVVDTVGLALAYKSAGDPRKMGPLLSTTPAQLLFRVGHSLSLRLQRELRARVQASGSGLAGNGLLLLDTPLRELAAGLLRPRPLVYGGLFDPRRLDFRPARTLAELAVAARAVSEIAFRAALLSRAFPVDTSGLDPAALPSHGAMLAALLVLRTLDDAAPWTPRPVQDAELTRARTALSGQAGARAVDAIVAHVKAVVAERGALPGLRDADDVEQRTRTYAEQVRAALLDEIAKVAGVVEGRFLASVWTTHPRPAPEPERD